MDRPIAEDSAFQLRPWAPNLRVSNAPNPLKPPRPRLQKRAVEMARRTPQQELDYQMQKMKDMGVTIIYTPASGVPADPNRSFALIADAAQAAGIYEEKSN